MPGFAFQLRHGAVQRRSHRRLEHTSAGIARCHGQCAATAIGALEPARCRTNGAADRGLQPHRAGLAGCASGLPVLRSPGAANPGGPGPGVCRPDPQLSRTQPTGQPAGALPAQPGRRRRSAGGHCRRAFAGTGDRPAGDHEGRWRLRAAGPGLPARTPGAHVRRQRRTPAADPASFA
ncbi:hypothetical protein D3C85_811060 [compost metagenome]